jgi:hypothetical protein
VKCPHCVVEFHADVMWEYLSSDVEGQWFIEMYECPNPACKKLTFYLVLGALGRKVTTEGVDAIRRRILVHPKGSHRPPVPPLVPEELAEDYTEACIVLPDSAKASAALSRRCLQNLLREVAKVKPGHLAGEIQEVLDGGTLPSHIAEAVDAIRNIGNFAAHPTKSESTGEILPVEPGEAEWNLDVLEALFDFYFVQPEVLRKKREALDAKLKAAGKSPMK